MTKIAVIIGSTRQGRQSDRLAKWVASYVKDKADTELLDLRDFPMPFLDEAISPRYNPERQPDEQTKKWLDTVSDFDGYVIVTPEYNRTTSGVMKNAIDVLDYQFENKPVALVAHGTSGGGQAVASLRMALPGVGAVTVPQALFFSDRLADAISEDGEMKEEVANRPYGPKANLEAQIDVLVKYAEALKSVR